MSGLKLTDQIRKAIRVKHYSYRTELSDIYWIKKFILFNNKRHPNEMGEQEINRFLTYLAVNKKVSASIRATPNAPSPNSLSQVSVGLI